MKTIKTIISLARYYRTGFGRILWRALWFECARLAPWVDLLRCRVFDYEMLVPTKVDGIGRALFVFGRRELDHKWMLEQVLAPGACIFDLGANIGYYALLEARIVNRDCRIFAIEPDPRNVDILRRNLASRHLEAVVSVDHGAISNRNGEAGMFLDKRSNLSRLAGSAVREGAGELVKVRVFDFKDYLMRLPGRMDLVRMDIEGGEIQVFESLAMMTKGGAETRRPRRIIFETHDYGAERDKMAGLLASVMAAGYRLEYISSDDELSGRSIIGGYGYAPRLVISEWGVSRGIYADIPSADAVEMIANWRGTRTVCLLCLD